MEVGIISNSISNKGAGISAYVNDLAMHLHKKINFKVLAISDVDSKTKQREYEVLFKKNNYIEKKIDFSFTLIQYFKDNKFDLLHINSIWKPINYFTYKFAKSNYIPFVISTHGMLEEWCLEQGALKKNIVKKLYVLNELNRAKCIHVTGENEYNAIRNYGVKAPIAILPIGIDSSNYLKETKGDLIIKKWPELKDKKIILFLSRVHPKKAVENLCHVWNAIYKNYSNYHLVIAGPYKDEYYKELIEILSRTSAIDYVTFTSAIYGSEKNELFALAELFVLPTYSENFGIVVLEALASKCLVITTYGTPWKDLEDYNCGWYIPIGVKHLKKAMEEALNIAEKKKIEMLNNGLNLIEKKYDWEQISAKMVELYEWSLDKRDTPEFIKID